MYTLRRTTAALGAVVLLAVPLSIVGTPPASAAERNFRCAGAEVDFEVDKRAGRFEIDVSIDSTRNSRWRIVLRHDGRIIRNRVFRADREGDIDLELRRPNTAGADVFKLRVKKIGGGHACVRKIRLR